MAAGARETNGVHEVKRSWRDTSDDRLVSLVRRGDEAAFEALYDRHARELLSFCRYMLGSLQDAEDAVQATFASAHRSLLTGNRRVDLRPWLFAIARNASLSILRRPHVTHEGERLATLTSDPFAMLEQREDLRQLVTGLLGLPERQRTALILAEMHGLRHADIGDVLGVRAEQVKAYVFQARSNLTADRRARALDCLTIREQLATARGHGLLKADIRRHLRACSACQEHLDVIARPRRLHALAPLAILAGLRNRLGGLLNGQTLAVRSADWGSPVASQAAELTGGGGLALVAKVLVGIALLGTGARLGAAGLGLTPRAEAKPASAATAVQNDRSSAPLIGAGSPRSGLRRTIGVSPGSTPGRGISSKPGSSGASGSDRQARSEVSASLPQATGAVSPQGEVAEVEHAPAHGPQEAHGPSEGPHGVREEGLDRSEEAHGKNEEPHGASEEVHGKSEGLHGKSEAAHGAGEEGPARSEAAHGSNEAARGNREDHGKGEETAGTAETAHTPGRPTAIGAPSGGEPPSIHAGSHPGA